MELFISGLVSFIVSFIMFWLGRIWDYFKDRKRLKIEKINLYNAIKYLRQAAISQLKTNQKIISEIDDNLKHPQGSINFTDLKINSDIKAYALKQIKSDDISKILIHNHKDKIDDRAYWHHLLLENIPLAEHTIDNLKQIQSDNHKDFSIRNQKIQDTYTEIRNLVIKEYSILNKKPIVTPDEMKLMQVYVDIQELAIEFFEQNMNIQPIGIERYNEIAFKMFQVAAPLQVHEILILCSIITNTYNELRGLNDSVRKNLLEVNKSLNNIKNTCDNIQKLEYPKEAEDFIKIKNQDESTLQTHRLNN